MAKGTLPEKLRRWADNRDSKPGINGNLLRDAADEIEKLRKRVQELESR
jgi:hypothetical protein